ncbi:hypothetical protein [Lacticaseibacillus daqingensis]|uniref:hypothetical protein n=1 Tax=Lacticaseibacillus daqingensis TaxID=2486014 RepID=UPI000F796CB0|nr:hypothetical protein [Lacticaseibacillus daqingensis]
MDAILMSLMAALNEQLLINVYQRDTEDFYTGYVQVLGKTSVVLSTYNDAGLADGSVLISFTAIDQVEFAGDDLDDMTFRIEVAEDRHFIALPAPAHPYAFDPTRDLIGQLAAQAHQSQEVILVMLADDDAYLEGQVTAVAADRFTLAVFNKFNYTDVRYLQVDFTDVLVIEFQGLELHLETTVVQNRDQLQHVRTDIHQNDGQLAAILSDAQVSGQLVAVMPQGNAAQFYVGRVLAVNPTVVVLQLRDMAGQFGGYVVLRLTGLQSVTLASDYLQTIGAYTAWMTAHHLEKQPVLNADREFDAGSDLFVSLVGEAAAFDRVIRVRTKEAGAQYMGVPRNVTGTTFVMHADDTDEDETLSFGAVQELAFGHVYAYLQEARLHSGR